MKKYSVWRVLFYLSWIYWKVLLKLLKCFVETDSTVPWLHLPRHHRVECNSQRLHSVLDSRLVHRCSHPRSGTAALPPGLLPQTKRTARHKSKNCIINVVLRPTCHTSSVLLLSFVFCHLFYDYANTILFTLESWVFLTYSPVTACVHL